MYFPDHDLSCWQLYFNCECVMIWIRETDLFVLSWSDNIIYRLIGEHLQIIGNQFTSLRLVRLRQNFPSCVLLESFISFVILQSAFLFFHFSYFLTFFQSSTMQALFGAIYGLRMALMESISSWGFSSLRYSLPIL